ncbi:hypothetical protein D1007_47820 [Hordeum vulgare]|nr:hypothetical protein D1007_47820 [Hordeum vulgare]
MSSSASKKGQFRGAWVGSEVGDEHIEALRQRRVLPPANLVVARVPGVEASSTPEKGEVVVFEEHFYRGFGLPARDFFAHFVSFFAFQPHHLVPNAILQLATVVVLSEGFIRIEPRLDLWRKQFFFKQQSAMMDKSVAAEQSGPKPMTPCGAALVHHRTMSGFTQLPLQDSIKNWQKGFFYVKNVDPSRDYIKLPPFAIALPTAKLDWKVTLPKPINEVAQVCAHLDNLNISSLLARDLLATMVARRVLPLQRRPHLICQMGGRHDPCQLSTKNFRVGAVARNVNLISAANMDEGGDWEWGMASYDQNHLAPVRLQNYQQPAADMEASDPAEIDDEGVVEPQVSASTDVEDAAESEGTESPGEHLKSTLLDWTDDDETPPPLHDVAFGEDQEDLEEVCSPPLTRARRNASETAAQGEEAQQKGKKGCEEVEEDTSSVSDRAAWATADAAKKALDKEANRPWEEAAWKMVDDQPQPSQAEKPAKERRSKTRHDPDSEPAPNRTEGARTA